jgi:peptidoglycan-associated lipoprotein
MYSKILGACVAVSLLAACSSSNTSSTSSTGSANLAMRDPLAGGGDKVFFDYDQSVIRDDARATLDGQANWLNRNQTVNVQIAGDCDERGTEEYNIALGSRRAYAAESYLAAKGIASNRMTTISYGKDRPIAPGSSEEAWAQNRNAITSVR